MPNNAQRKILYGVLLLAGIALGWWWKSRFQAVMTTAQEQAAQKWVGTWVGGDVEFDIGKGPSGTYQLHNRTFNFTCDVTLDDEHARWHGPPGSWVMDVALSADGKRASGQGTDDQGQGLHKDFEFQKLSHQP